MNKWIQSKIWGEFGVHIILVCDQSGCGQPLQKEEAQDMHNRHNMYTKRRLDITHIYATVT